MDSAIGLNGGQSFERDELWSAALERLQGEYSNSNFEMWLKPMRFVESGSSEIVLSVHSRFAREWVEVRFKDDLAQVLSGLLGEPVNIRFIVADGIESADDSPASRKSSERLDRIEARIAALEAHVAAKMERT